MASLAPSNRYLAPGLAAGATAIGVCAVLGLMPNTGAAASIAWLAAAALIMALGVVCAQLRQATRACDAALEALKSGPAPLARDEHRRDAVLNALPALIGYVDRTETYRYTNALHANYLEIEPHRLLGKSMRDLLGPQAYRMVKPRIDRVLAGEPQTFERLQRTEAGDTHVLVHYVPDVAEDGSGDVRGFHIMVVDITGRKTAEMAQQVNERRLKAINDNVPATVAHIDRNHRFLTANEEHRRLFGLEPESIVGRTLQEVRGDTFFRQATEHLLAVLQGHTRRFEVRELIDGIEHHLQQSLIPDIDESGTVQGYYAVSFDITDLRRHEQLLLESSARHRLIVEEQSELISLAREDGELVYVNPSYARHFGRSRSTLVGTNLLELVDPADRPHVRIALASVYATGVPWAGEQRVSHADGRKTRVAWTCTLQRDGLGTATLRSVGRDVTDQRLAEQALRASENFLARTGRLARVGGWQFDIEGETLTWSDEVRRIHEVPDDYTPTLATSVDFYHPAARPAIEAAVRRGIDLGESWDLELELTTATGRSIWVRAVGDVELEGGKATRLVGAIQDITRRKLAELAIEKEQERLLRTVTDNLPVFILCADADEAESVRFVNATGEAWLGIPTGAAVGRPLAEVLGPVRYEAHRERIRRVLAGERVQGEAVIGRSGVTRHVQLLFTPDLRSDGSVAGFFALLTDITTLKQTQLQLEALARLDTLTGLPNRRQFEEKLGEAMRRRRRSDHPLALMFLDIDHFKSINDTLGHAGGDAVLKEFGARLKASVRDTDLVARLAGDEFVVLLEGMASEADASHVARKVINAMRVDFTIDGQPVRVTTSLGIGFASEHTATPNELVMCADKALYEAKREGRDRFSLSNFAEL